MPRLHQIPGTQRHIGHLSVHGELIVVGVGSGEGRGGELVRARD